MDTSQKQDEEKAKLEEDQEKEREDERIRLQKEADDAHEVAEKAKGEERNADTQAQKL